MRKPALLSAFWFAIGIVIQVILGFPDVWLLGVGTGLVLMFWVLIVFKKDAWASGGCCVVLVLLGALRFELGVRQMDPNHYLNVLTGNEVIIEGHLVSEPEVQARGWRAEMAVISVCAGDTTWKTSGRMLVRFGEKIAQATYGDVMVLRVVPTLPEPARNPGGFDYQQYLFLRGIRALAYVSRDDQILVKEVGTGSWWMQGVIPVRKIIQGAIEQNLSGGPAGLLKGILLGDKRSVPTEVRDVFSRCGVNHVLAVSGLHVGLIASVVFFGLKVCGVGRGATTWITVLMLVVYALVTGMPPSVIRASVMASLIILGRLGEWESDGWNALGVAGLVGLIARPADILDVGFQLSFAATGGIMLFYRPLLDCLPQWGGRFMAQAIWAPLAVSLAAQLTTMPFIVTYFGVVSVVGLVANLIIVPLVGIAAGLGLVSVFVYPLLPMVVVWFNGANWVILKGAIGLAQFMASVSWAAIDVPHLPWFLWGIYGLGTLLFLPLFRQRPYRIYVFSGVLLCANYGVWQPIWVGPRHMEMFVLDIGQGDAIFMRFPNGKTMLVDGGIRTQHMDMGNRVVLPFLRSQGISHIDVVVGSHAHSDHIGGLIAVLERVHVGHYLDSGQPANTWTAREVRRLVSEKGVRYHAVAAGDSLVGLGGVGGVVLHPVADFVSDEDGVSHGLNNGSVVMRFTYLGRSILLTGDIEHETDGALLRWNERLRADILKAAHHGSRTSSTQAFLNGVRPSWVAVSCGIKNKFRHPSPDVIDRYAQMGIHIMRTDLSGAIRFFIGEEGITTQTWLVHNK